MIPSVEWLEEQDISFDVYTKALIYMRDKKGEKKDETGLFKNS